MMGLFNTNFMQSKFVRRFCYPIQPKWLKKKFFQAEKAKERRKKFIAEYNKRRL